MCVLQALQIDDIVQILDKDSIPGLRESIKTVINDMRKRNKLKMFSRLYPSNSICGKRKTCENI